MGTDPAAGTGYGYEALPLAARYAVSAAIGRDRQAYHFTENTEGLRGNNPSQSYEMGFSDKAVEIGAEGHQWGLSLSGWGMALTGIRWNRSSLWLRATAWNIAERL